eukprot:CFRG3370T1
MKGIQQHVNSLEQLSPVSQYFLQFLEKAGELIMSILKVHVYLYVFIREGIYFLCGILVKDNVVHPPPRVLSAEQLEKLKKEKPVSEKLKSLFERDARRNWDLFYKRNKNNFYKDRHWLTREFKRWFPVEKDTTFSIVEVGCGVGNLFFPLMEQYPNLIIYGFDLSANAINIIKQHPLYKEETVTAFTCDATQTPLTVKIPANSVDMASMMYVLSAVHPNNMKKVIMNVVSILKPGAIIIFRDYGIYDEAMLRFKAGAKLSDQFYVRHDGTRAYYFDLNEVETMFRECGTHVVHSEYVHREVVNRKENRTMARVFVQLVLSKR